MSDDKTAGAGSGPPLRHLATDMSRVLLVFSVLLVAASAGIAHWEKCRGSSVDICDVSEVRVDPCKGEKFCKLKKLKSASIQVDYTPNFNSGNMTTTLFWSSSSGDLPFAELNGADACKYTTCPLEAGKVQTFDYSLYISKMLPTGKYPLKWVLTNANNAQEYCCIITNVEIRR